jgi:hypothetical protein
VVDREAIERLLDQHRVAAVLDLVSLDEAAAAWIEYEVSGARRREEPWADENWWGHELGDQPNIDWPADLFRAFIARVIELAPDDALPAVGWGLLDKFLEFDETSVDWLVEQAGTCGRFRQALGHLSGFNLDEASDEAVERLEQAAGVRLRRWPE